MGSEEESSHSEAPQTDTAGAKSNPRPGRRSGRGRRSFGRRGRQPREPVHKPPIPALAEQAPVQEAEAVFELASERPVQQPEAATTSDAEFVSEAPQPEAAPIAEPPVQPASPAAVHAAIDEVNSLVETLRTALEDMEEVLEMLELFERQQNADEREIES